jgi:hypothetical protein
MHLNILLAYNVKINYSTPIFIEGILGLGEWAFANNFIVFLNQW